MFTYMSSSKWQYQLMLKVGRGVEPSKKGEEPSKKGEEPSKKGEEPSKKGVEPSKKGEEHPKMMVWERNYLIISSTPYLQYP